MEVLSITVRVKPGASRTRVGGSYGEDRQLVVAVNAPPVDGAANDAVIEALSKALDVRRRDIAITSGHTARSKRVDLHIDADDRDTMSTRIAALLDS